MVAGVAEGEEVTQAVPVECRDTGSCCGLLTTMSEVPSQHGELLSSFTSVVATNWRLSPGTLTRRYVLAQRMPLAAKSRPLECAPALAAGFMSPGVHVSVAADISAAPLENKGHIRTCSLPNEL